MNDNTMHQANANRSDMDGQQPAQAVAELSAQAVDTVSGGMAYAGLSWPVVAWRGLCGRLRRWHRNRQALHRTALEVSGGPFAVGRPWACGPHAWAARRTGRLQAPGHARRPCQ